MMFAAPFIADDRGADLVEYALLIGLIAVAALAALSDVGSKVSGAFTAVIAKLNAVPQS